MNLILNYISFDISKIDSKAIFISVVGYILVLIALAILVLIFKAFPKMLAYFTRLRMRKLGKEVDELPIEEGVSGEVTAAITTALYLYFNEHHDHESNIITIKRSPKEYTPWSSKHLNLYH